MITGIGHLITGITGGQREAVERGEKGKGGGGGMREGKERVKGVVEGKGAKGRGGRGGSYEGGKGMVNVGE